MALPSDETLRALITAGGELELPYFNGARVDVEPADFDSADLEPALKHFLALTGEDRLAHSRHLFAFHELMVAECGNPLTDPPHPEKPEHIWDHGRPSLLSFTHFDPWGTPSPTGVVVVVTCDASWESHGVSLFFDYGKELCKVGSPQAGPEVKKEGRIFDCYREEFCTYRDDLTD